MGRVVRAICLLAITALWLAIVLAWWRSGSVMDEWSYVDDQNTLRGAISFKGGIHLIHAQRNSTRRDLGWDTLDIPSRGTVKELHLGRNVEWEHFGFARLTHAPPPPAFRPFAKPLLRGAAPPPMSAAVAPWLQTSPYEAWIIPYWAPLAVLSLPLGVSGFRFSRRWHRRRHGRCASCGYDLRETPERCPECGAEKPSSNGRAL